MKITDPTKLRLDWIVAHPQAMSIMAFLKM